MTGPAPWQISAIKTHGLCPDGSNSCPDADRTPKEKTIVLVVTDGDDTCATRTGNGSTASIQNALRAARKAEDLYAGVGATPDPASRVETYVIGYGNGAAPDKMNWIAWGGSGMVAGTSNPGTTGSGESERWTASDEGSDTRVSNALAAAKAACSTCRNAILAPTAEKLATKMQAIIDQGASDGDFNAQQSITESVYEYVSLASISGDENHTYDANSSATRYGAIVPTRFVSSFTLPGFRGQFRAYQNDGSGNSVLKWSAGDKLTDTVRNSMATCDTTTAGGALGRCVFPQLHGGATDATIATSAAKIKRRIYTNSNNGVYSFSPATLIAGIADGRKSLWPPEPGYAPTDYGAQGILDVQLGLPDDGVADPATEFTNLQDLYQACLGTNLPAECGGAQPALTRMRAARKEARDMIFAFMAGAAPVAADTGWARTTASVAEAPAGSILFTARDWLLGDSEMATPAVISPPSSEAPEPYLHEYELFRDGPRDDLNRNPDSGGEQIKEGFGLTNPDQDSIANPSTRPHLRPVMTVAYLPANDMLHAFRAGPNCSPDSASCDQRGGEELWGFVPYDEIRALSLRFANDPQGRDNHVFMLARGIRFGDVFVPGALTVDIGGKTEDLKGVWRRVIYFGRGIGGKYLTALDVTAPGAFTDKALDTRGPIPLWSRGNPDTQDGTPTGTKNGSNADFDAYAKMGETWSMPTLAYVNSGKDNDTYKTARRRDGIDFAIFVGSGYGEPGEGTTHYTLDALSGDVIAAVDVEEAAASYGLSRSGLPYRNALVANSVSFNRVISQTLKTNHPWSFESQRVYFGDLYGRLWKLLTAKPDVVIPAADFGADQPIATAVGLVTRDPEAEGLDTKGPYIFVSSGADDRADGPFRNFALRDDGTDTDATTTGTATSDGVTTFEPVELQFARTFDQGTPEADCGYDEEAVFRGTVQPTGSFECTVKDGKCEAGTTVWRVFFAGTRLSLPNTKFAPPTPLACGNDGRYPCRSQFDTIIYALSVETGHAAYDLNASGDDAYRIFRDSRIAAISMQADPQTGGGGSRFVADEGLMKGTPAAPPPPGVPPTAPTKTPSVVFKKNAGEPEPAVRYGSTVCQ